MLQWSQFDMTYVDEDGNIRESEYYRPHLTNKYSLSSYIIEFMNWLV